MGIRHYVIQTDDPSVATTKIAMAELNSKGFETTWLAISETYTDRHRQTRTLQMSLFPGYLFVAFDAALEGWKKIQGCRGVRGILGPSEHPTALPEGCLDHLRARFAAGEFKTKAAAPLVPGDQVVVEVGPDRNAIGVVTMSRGDRIKVLFSFMGDQQNWIGADRVRRMA